jgi:hypothetical protein
MTTLEPKHIRALEALLSAKTIGEAAALADVPYSTIYNWITEPVFRAELDRLSAELYAAVKGRLTAACNLAVDVMMTELRSDQPNRVKVNIAETVFDRAAKFAEHFDLLERVKALEQHQSTPTTPSPSPAQQ